MTPRYAVPLAALALVLSACGDHPVSSKPAVDPAGQVTLTVHTSIRPGQHGEMFSEGAVPEVRLTAADGTVVEPARDHADDAVFAGVAPGRYRLTAALRPCDGSCGHLDDPTTPCSASMAVRADREVAVTWRVGERCRVA